MEYCGKKWYIHRVFEIILFFSTTKFSSGTTGQMVGANECYIQGSCCLIAINKKIAFQLYEAGFEVEFDEMCSDTLNKQIRNAQLAQFNFILVVGPKEAQNGTVNVRTRDNAVRDFMRFHTFISLFHTFISPEETTVSKLVGKSSFR